MLRQQLEDLIHRLVEVDLHNAAAEVVVGDLGHVFRRIGFKLLEKDAVPGDLALGLTVGGTRNPDADGQRRAVARQADDAHIVAEVLAAELGANAGCLGQLVDFGFHFQIAESVGILAA